jgi:ClpP class serine protease
MQMVGKVAHINISGVLEPERVAAYDYWGIEHTAYADIVAQTVAAKDAGAESIQYNARSGGGNIEGMLPAMKAIDGAGIPTKMVVSGVAASAMYMLASQSNTIEATSELDIFGSFGVVTSRYVSENFVEITNSDSPNKRPDASTDDGVKAIEKELDDIFGVVVPHVARGRRTDVETVKKNFGQGGIMTAKTALAKGMIDSIYEPTAAQSNKTTAGVPAKNRSDKMDRTQLKADHPELFASILLEGKEAGKKEFQAFASGHMKLAEASGDTARAIADIAAMNDPRDVECTIHHQSVAIKKAQVDARGDEAPDAIGAGDEQTMSIDDEINAAYADEEGLVM